MELIQAKYKSVDHVLQSLKKQGVKNINNNRPKGLMGKTKWQQFKDGLNINQLDHSVLLTYEVIYGHAWKGQVHHQPEGSEVRFPISKLRKMG